MAQYYDEKGNPITVFDVGGKPVLPYSGNYGMDSNPEHDLGNLGLTRSFDFLGNSNATPQESVPAMPGTAAERYAQVTREQWEDYVKRFFPLEDELIASYKNPEDLQNRIDTAKGLSNTAFDVSTAGAQRTAARYGLNLNDPAYQRQLKMNRVASEVDSSNEIRRHVAARDQKLLSGGLTAERGLS